MKIEIRDFGPIHKFDFDLSKDLIAIYGDNNIGKSYALSLLYIIIKNLSKFRTELKRYPIITTKFESKDLKRMIEERAENWFYIYMINNFENSIKQSYGNIINQYTQKQVNISISNEDMNLSIKIDKKMWYRINVEFYNNIEVKKSIRREKYFKKDNQITLYLKENLTLDEVIQDYVLDQLSTFTEEMSVPLFLPASRSGLYQAMSSFNQIFAELSQKKSEVNSKIEIPSFSEPVSDFYLNLTNDNLRYSKNYNKLYSLIHAFESKILHGSIELDSENKKLFFHDDESSLNLTLSQTSSMISELAPIIGLLKFYNSEDINFKYILIEEPEVHLHPRIQIEILKFLVDLTEVGMKVVFITHSNYIFNQLNNMILRNDISYDKICPIKLEKGNNGNFSSLLEIDELGVEDENFTDTNEQLYHEQLHIINKLNDDKKN